MENHCHPYCTSFLIVYSHLQELQVNWPSGIAELWLANSLEKYETSFRKQSSVVFDETVSWNSKNLLKHVSRMYTPWNFCLQQWVADRNFIVCTKLKCGISQLQVLSLVSSRKSGHHSKVLSGKPIIHIWGLPIRDLQVLSAHCGQNPWISSRRRKDFYKLFEED